MSLTTARPWPRLLCAGALMLLAQLAHAQYSWIDDKGTRVFSDRPPPPGTPASRILKAPHRLDAAAAQPDAQPHDKPNDKPADKAAGPTLAEREADYRKRMAQRDKDEQKAAQDAQQKAALAVQCDAVRSSERTLASGVRISDTNANGQQEFLSDEQRAARLARARSALASCN